MRVDIFVPVITHGDVARGFGLWILGSLEARTDQATIAVGGRRSQCLLACLLVNVDRVVSIDHLIDAVWDDDSPAGARVQVQNRVSTLRQHLRLGGLGDLIVRRAPGYLIHPGGVPFDLSRFERAIAEADDLARDGRFAEASGVLRSALELWHGPALDGLNTRYLRAAAQSLEERRLHALDTRIRWDLRLGRHADVVAELAELAAQHPYRESFVELLIKALAADGQRSAAIDAYDRHRRRLADDLGIDPSPPVQAAFAAVLQRCGRQSPTGRPVPVQLPADVPFAGRAVELAVLDTMLPGGHAHGCAVVVAGPAGVGKSALAIHWARRSAAHFPDGQLYVNLRGFSPHGRPVAAQDALRVLLDALHVPTDDIPTDLQARVGLYRSLLAHRRVLVLLDNARDAEQARPLLPATHGCLAIVTSREALTGLAVTEGAQLLPLDLLDAQDATALLAQRIGQRRITAEPDAARSIVEECGRLPLALAVAAARVAVGGGRSLASFAAELRSARGTLDAFADADRVSDVRMIFSLSYRALSTPAARIFRLLHLLIDGSPTAAVAALAGLRPAETSPLLAELVDASLIRTCAPDRYTIHDLFRAYAGVLSRDTDAEPDRQAALCRMLSYHLHSAYAADRLLFPHRTAMALGPPPAGIVPARPGDAGEATAWFAREITALLEAVVLASSHGLHGPAWMLAWCLTTYLNRTGHWHEWTSVQRTALAAAERLGDPARRALSHRDLALAAVRLREYDRARRQMREALSLYGQIGDTTEQARCYGGMAWAEERAGHYAEALGYAQAKLTLVRSAANPAQTGSALNMVGWYHALLGNYEPAIRYCREGLHYFQKAGDLHGEAYTWDSLGYVEQQLGHHGTAIAHYRQAIALASRIGERYLTAKLLSQLGDTHESAGDPEAARRAWREALDIFDHIDERDAALMRARLIP